MGWSLNAQFNVAAGLAIDNVSGTLYIADSGNNRVRAISPTGTIQTVAGTGVQGFSGDGGLGVAAELSGPTGVAVDAGGNVYIADSGNSRIRMLSSSGLISTVAGNGTEDLGPEAMSTPGGTFPETATAVQAF